MEKCKSGEERKKESKVPLKKTAEKKKEKKNLHKFISHWIFYRHISRSLKQKYLIVEHLFSA